MGRLARQILTGLMAIAASLAVGQTAWSQDTVCGSADSPAACQNCFDAAGGDKQAICECHCKWFTPKEMSKKECLAEVCGSGKDGVGSKIGLGSVFGGTVYPTVIEAIAAAQDFRVQNDLVDNVTVVMKDFYPITGDADSWVVHYVGIPGWYPGDADEYFPDPVCGPDGEGCALSMSAPTCTNGINQDGDPFSPGCQPAKGCREIPPSEWMALGCPTNIGCCADPAGCGPLAGGPDLLAANGRYGTNGVDCP